MNTQTYTVNIRTGVVNITRVDVSQGDTGRTLAFSLYDGLIPFTPPNGSTVTIVGRKPSGLGFSETCTVSGNTAAVNTTLAMTQESGKIPVELRIESDTRSIGTANFTMYVEPSPHPDGTTDGTHATVDNLQTQIGDLANLTTTAKTNLVSAINEAAQSGGTEVVIDNTLTQTGQAADAKKTGDEISAIKADLEDLDERVEALESGSGGSGLTESIKTALMNIVNHVTWDDDDPTGQTYITALQNALYPPAELVSISAVYTQSGTVYDTDSLDSLKSDLVVTATWSDSSTSILNGTGYTLSGTLAEGTSTITVAYGGKTDTFNVTVTRDLSITWDYTMGLPNANGFTLAQSESGSPSATLEADGVRMVVSGPTENYIRYEYNTPTPNGTFEFQFKSGSASNLKIMAHLATDSSGNGISVRMQYSSGYKGIYLIDGSEGISSYTLLKAMVLNTVYTVKFVVNNGLVDVYVDDEKLAEGVPVNSFSQNTATYFHLGSSSSTTASVNCKLMSMSIRV